MNMKKIKLFCSFILISIASLFSLGLECHIPTPIGELENCDKWVTYRITGSSGFWFKYKTIHYKNYSEPEQPDFFMGLVGNVYKVPSSYIISIQTLTNSCNATDWIVKWDFAQVFIPRGHTGFTLYREKCLIGNCELPSNNPIL